LCLLNRLLLLRLGGSLLRLRRLRLLLRLFLLCRFGFLLRLSSGLFRLRLFLLRRFGFPLRLLRRRLRVLLRCSLLLLWRLALLFLRRLALALLLLRGQYTDRPGNHKQGESAGRSNELHGLVSIRITIE
jgi:hypothetical protein